jgi:hypothetical protein
MASSDTLVDPTRPPGAHAAVSAASDQPLRLEAILASGAKRTAIVNGQLVNEGEHVADAVVDSITADSIRYTRHGRTYVSTLATPQRLNIRPAASQGKQP